MSSAPPRESTGPSAPSAGSPIAGRRYGSSVPSPTTESEDRTAGESPPAAAATTTEGASDPTPRRKPTASSSNRRFPFARRAGGVAPFVRPPNRFARWRSLRGWRRRGFVPLSPAREKRRHRILPRTVIGISTMLMMLGVGAAFSGAAFYAYYDDRLATNEQEVARFLEGFDEQFDDAAGSLDRIREESVDQIRAELLPLEQYTADVNGVVLLPQQIGASIWRVETTDEAGRPIVGSAFAVTGFSGGSALLTDLSIVRAATLAPSPVIRLVKAERSMTATLWTWDDAAGLALLVTDEEIPALALASQSQRTALIGRAIFAMSGTGGQGATASPGQLLDRTQDGLQHTSPLAPAFFGGPLVDADGRVVGIATNATGAPSLGVWSAPDASRFCERVLRCAETGDAVVVEDVPDSLPADG